MSFSAQPATRWPLTPERRQHGRLRLVPTAVGGISAAVDDTACEIDRLLETGEITPAEHDALIRFCIDFNRAHRQPRVVMRYEPASGGRTADDDDAEAVAAQRRMNGVLKVAGPAASLLVGLALGENINDMAHRRRCSRQELLAVLKATVKRILSAKLPPKEALDE
jgi:hypothetical protein